jgi:hypothetical protein
MPGQFPARADVPQKAAPHPGKFRAIFVNAWNLLTRQASIGTALAQDAPAGKMPTSNRSPKNPPESLQMVINAAHVPAIVALIAGILILIMPRLLNFIVAIYLIFVGLVGMGLLRWLHL